MKAKSKQTPAPRRAGTSKKVSRITRERSVAERLAQLRTDDPAAYAEVITLLFVLTQKK